MNMDRIFSVSEITKAISVLFDEAIGRTSIRGEISNFKQHSSGHRYFSLKDENAQISCVMWKSRPILFEAADGMTIIANGNITVYPPRGQYQLDCISISPLGKGSLYLAFEKLKKKLADLGYFDDDRKRRIPNFPLKIGIATSKTGAAIQDMITAIKRRMPLCTIYFRPTFVQGEGSAEDIAMAIEELNQYQLDIIIIGRGGGSLEDLWSFNTEIVANAVYNSKIPVISAVGHETDFTISDFVADLRAPTPTAAAEFVTSLTIKQLNQNLIQLQDLMLKSINSKFNQHKSQLNIFLKSNSFKRFNEKIKLYQQLLDDYTTAMENDINKVIKNHKEKIFQKQMQCESLAPLAPLRKGFALLAKDGKYLNNMDSLMTIKELDIIREYEKANVSVNSCLKT